MHALSKLVGKMDGKKNVLLCSDSTEVVKYMDKLLYDSQECGDIPLDILQVAKLVKFKIINRKYNVVEGWI